MRVTCPSSKQYNHWSDVLSLTIKIIVTNFSKRCNGWVQFLWEVNKIIQVLDVSKLTLKEMLYISQIQKRTTHQHWCAVSSNFLYLLWFKFIFGFNFLKPQECDFNFPQFRIMTMRQYEPMKGQNWNGLKKMIKVNFNVYMYELT